jgi:hypothetical protein
LQKSTPKPRAAPTPESIAALKAKKAWDVAFGPAKNLPMNAFMLYMSGAGVQIFSMMVVGMLLTNPIKAALGVQGGEFCPPPTAKEGRGERVRGRVGEEKGENRRDRAGSRCAGAESGSLLEKERAWKKG